MTDDIRPPRDGYRAISWPAGFRAEPDRAPQLTGHFARFGVFNEINSVIEGRFLERIDPGAFTRTFKNNSDQIRVLFQHGKDPAMGEKPIAKVTSLRSDNVGPYYEADLLDGIDPLVLDGLRHGQYGVSYRFQATAEDWVPRPPKSDYNPNALPERTIKEARVFEFGPVTFPADAGADVAVRSLSDEMSDPNQEPVAPSPEPEAEEPHLEPEARDEPEPIADIPEEKPVPEITEYRTLEEMAARVHELNAEIKRTAELPGLLPEKEQADFDAKVKERAKLDNEMAAWRSRLDQVRTLTETEDEAKTIRAYAPVNIVKKRDEASIYDVRAVTRNARNDEDRAQALRDNAMRAVEGAAFAASERTAAQAEVEKLLRGVDLVDPSAAAERILYTGKPAYRRAYRKFLTQGQAGPMFTPEEAAAYEETRAALVTLANTAVPFDLDPTMANNTSGAINPYRQAFRVVKTTSNDWRPQVSGGMTAAYVAEATAATEGAPTFTAPASLLQKAHTAATFSVEIQGDFPGLEAELAKEIADAKDVLEATKFGLGAGSGSDEPLGIYTYYTANFLDTTTTLVIVPEDLYKLERNLGPRYRQNAVWLGSGYFYSLVRGIDTAGGAGIWKDNLSLPSFGSPENNGMVGALLGHPAYEAIAPTEGAMATTNKVAILAARDRFVIIDRIGMNIELIPNFMDAATGYPTGQRMVYAWWRNYSTGIGLATLGAGRSSCIFRGK